ncbi:hypothetical protein [Acetobacter senegalensis]|uniref:hypothetical protein n=1 Tax=Acetobacter senegalensis TaxID=446692 RepID=UPI001ED9DD2C|nr:hypothetical protein [Acetobacter senegalensis]MCG4258164.1 hypothetical protein [Acetobacter senegalensis]MCG4268091.1 hypothetical protein [Acetobacter senegalensis]
MTNPTNWPNPERPGVPMFPDRDGLHVLKWGNSPILIWDKDPHPQAAMEIWEWDSKTQKWGIILAKNMVREGYSYISPILTPTQISEMLAAEREQCAVAIEKEKPTEDDACRSQYLNTKFHTISRGAAEIRNLGAAP